MKNLHICLIMIRMNQQTLMMKSLEMKHHIVIASNHLKQSHLILLTWMIGMGGIIAIIMKKAKQMVCLTKRNQKLLIYLRIINHNKMNSHKIHSSKRNNRKIPNSNKHSLSSKKNQLNHSIKEVLNIM